MYNKTTLLKELEILGYNKDFCKMVDVELFGFDGKTSYTKESLKQWLDIYCNKPKSLYDYEQADDYFNFENGTYERYSDWLYFIVKGLLQDDIKKYLTHLHK